MATTIKIKRSTGTSAPSSLTAGELAYTGGAGAQGGAGGKGCDTVGSVCLAINILFAKTVLCPGVSSIVVPAHMCPVLN